MNLWVIIKKTDNKSNVEEQTNPDSKTNINKVINNDNNQQKEKNKQIKILINLYLLDLEDKKTNCYNIQ